MFVEGFDPTAELATTACPRCLRVGLLEAGREKFDAASQRHEPKFIVLPSLTVLCPSCNTVTEWPACTFEE